MSSVNVPEAQRQLRRNRNKTGLIFAGIAGATILGQLIFRPRWRKQDVLTLALPLGRMAIDMLTFKRMASTAVPVENHPNIGNAFERAFDNSGLEKRPQLLVIPHTAPNALTTGLTDAGARVHANTGLETSANMDGTELEAVMAHELAHVRNRDVRLMAAATVCLMAAGKTVVEPVLTRARKRYGTAGWLAVQLGSLLASHATLMFLARTRESTADVEAALTTGNPQALATSLRALERTTPSKRFRKPQFMENHPSVSTRVRDLDRITQ